MAKKLKAKLSKTKAGKKIKKAKKPNKILKSKKVKKIKKAISKKRAKLVENHVTASQDLFKPRIKVIGIGGGGGSIVSDMGSALSKATFMIADTDLRSFKKKNKIKYLVFGQDLTHGLGTGSNIEIAKKAAEGIKEKIEEAVKDQDIVIFVASLGGGVGSGAAEIFSDVARNLNVMTLGIFLLPFKFEGQDKHRIARESLKSLKSKLNVSLIIPNERIFKIISEDTVITEAFSMVNKNLIQSLESLIDLIHNPGLINIDFADLKTVLGGIGNGAFLNTLEESGKDRAEKISKNIFSNPLLLSSGFKYERVLLNIAGSKNLSMLEVSKISTHVSSLAPGAKIIFGISKDNSLKSRIKATLLITGLYADSASPPKVKPLEKKKLQKKIKPKPRPSYEDKKIKIIPLNPVFEESMKEAEVLEKSEINFTKVEKVQSKNAIRRSGLDVKKELEKEEKKKQMQEEEWEIPAFLRLKK